MRSCLLIAGRHDPGVEICRREIEALVDSADEPLEFHTGIKRSHHSRKYKCEAVVQVQRNRYILQLLVTDRNGNSETVHVKDIEPQLWFPDYGFAKIRWDGDEIICLEDNVWASVIPGLVST